MNAKQIKKLRKLVKPIQVEWLQTLLPDEQATTITVDNVEGLLMNNQRYFTLLGTGLNNFAGKALLLSHDDEGETTATNWTLQDVKNMVEWLPETHRETPYMEFFAWK